MSTVSVDTLRVGGGALYYVEPSVVARNARGDVLLAGDISILLEYRDQQWRFTRKDSTFGAVITNGGAPAVIAAPIPTRLLGGIRAAPRHDGTWLVMFGERPEYTGTPPDSLVRLWAGTLDGNVWRSVRPVPVPPGGTLLGWHPSQLTIRGDTIFAALTFRNGGFRDVALFTHVDGEWRSEIVPVRHNLYAQLAYTDVLGLVLASVGGSGAPANAGNTVVMWRRAPAWEPFHAVVTPGSESVFEPWLSITPEDQVLSWESPAEFPGRGWEARAILNPLDPRSQVVVLDSSIASARGSVRPLRARHGRLWVLAHSEPHTGENEIRFVMEAGGRTVLLGSIPNPYLSGFAAILDGPDEVLVSGGIYNAEERFAVSVLIRARVTCETS